MRNLVIVSVLVLVCVGCGSPTEPTQPIFSISPVSAVVQVGRSQIFTVSGANDISFVLDMYGADYHRYVNVSGQSSSSIQLTGVSSMFGNPNSIHITAVIQGGRNVTASLRVIP